MNKRYLSAAEPALPNQWLAKPMKKPESVRSASALIEKSDKMKVEPVAVPVPHAMPKQASKLSFFTTRPLPPKM